MQVASEEERQWFRDHMAALLFFVVLPAARELSAQSKLQQVPLRRLEAQLRPSGKMLRWHFEASPVINLVVDERGIMRPLYDLEGFRFHPLRERRFKRCGVEISDIAEIVARFKVSQAKA
jgi:hypothetical protein